MIFFFKFRFHVLLPIALVAWSVYFDFPTRSSSLPHYWLPLNALLFFIVNSMELRSGCWSILKNEVQHLMKSKGRQSVSSLPSHEEALHCPMSFQPQGQRKFSQHIQLFRLFSQLGRPDTQNNQISILSHSGSQISEAYALLNASCFLIFVPALHTVLQLLAQLKVGKFQSSVFLPKVAWQLCTDLSSNLIQKHSQDLEAKRKTAKQGHLVFRIFNFKNIEVRRYVGLECISDFTIIIPKNQYFSQKTYS